MAGKITDLAALTAPADDDLIEVVDISDTTMAATGTNKKMALSDLPTGGTPLAGLDRVLFNEGYYGGLPGRALFWGQAQAFTLNWAYAFPFVVAPGETATFSRYKVYVDPGAAGAKLNLGVYSAPSFADNLTATRVTAAEQLDIDCSTAGGKTIVLPAPVTLPSGCYYLVHSQHGASTTIWALTATQGYMGANIGMGNGAAYGSIVVAISGTTLAATYLVTVNYAGTGYNLVPCTMGL